MSRRVSSHSRETTDISRALRRAARKALELGIKTGNSSLCAQEQQDRRPDTGPTRYEKLTVKAGEIVLDRIYKI